MQTGGQEPVIGHPPILEGWLGKRRRRRWPWSAAFKDRYVVLTRDTLTIRRAQAAETKKYASDLKHILDVKRGAEKHGFKVSFQIGYGADWEFACTDEASRDRWMEKLKTHAETRYHAVREEYRARYGVYPEEGRQDPNWAQQFDSQGDYQQEETYMGY
uniref:PH domain-containing protein n=1 Tax=Chromera velia CCMP2878 TaxID=1169474 RepID=A0A0G4F1I9_9ALVE|mmetsp:Transcript_11146/g.21544  ORF Transcript_11146/g.21544 Transcript_11146/m.21544 type:complete len:159 (+) Transcript_11146:329-805(+)|eukprot:Cvel_14562.t1-p1 / transcript=Cvel_14562.t1 / gene=Cvel_14562 / organism=Chromera_velia_CCMP2878 / gene_product=hypothetical protein / transcript_product=hypothetical protein / location=Cvel_scaffold1041:1307-1780(-) / protein_length=158 / sequence_SO=supercontig / SO=protein_coding / is_pseudo=false